MENQSINQQSIGLFLVNYFHIMKMINQMTMNIE